MDVQRDELMSLSVVRQIAAGLKDTIVGPELDNRCDLIPGPKVQLIAAYRGLYELLEQVSGQILSS